MAEDQVVETIENETDIEDRAAMSEGQVTGMPEEVIEGSASARLERPDFRAGDTLRLGVRITEGEKTRIQYFEGIVLARRGMGMSQSFTIRRIGAAGIAVERIFPLYSPTLASIEVRRRGITRRAKVYFLRNIVGSTANVIKERKVSRDVTAAKAAKAQKKAVRRAKKDIQEAPKAPVSGSRSARRAARKSAE